MQFQITLPEPNVGREDRLIRAVVAACLLSMSAFGLISTRSLSLISLLFALSGGYFAWSAAKGRCFAYERLAIDTRSESEAAAQAARAAAAAAAAQARQARSLDESSKSDSDSEAPIPAASAQSEPSHITTATRETREVQDRKVKPGRARALQVKEPLQARPNPEEPGPHQAGPHQAGPDQAGPEPAGSSQTKSSQDPRRVRRKAAPADEWGHSLLGR